MTRSVLLTCWSSHGCLDCFSSLSWTVPAWIFMCRLQWTFSSGIYLGVKLTHHVATLCLTFQGATSLFSKVVTQLFVSACSFSTSLSTSPSVLLMISIPGSANGCFLMVCICISLRANPDRFLNLTFRARILPHLGAFVFRFAVGFPCVSPPCGSWKITRVNSASLLF